MNPLQKLAEKLSLALTVADVFGDGKIDAAYPMSDELTAQLLSDIYIATNRVDEYGFLARRQLQDGRWLCVVPLFGGRARLTIGHGLLGWDHGY